MNDDTPPPDDDPLAVIEEEAFWYSLALAVVAMAPVPLVYPAVSATVLLGLRILERTRQVQHEDASDDRANARLFACGMVLLAVAYKVSGMAPFALILMICSMFLFNAVRNLRILARVETRRRSGQTKTPPAQPQ